MKNIIKSKILRLTQATVFKANYLLDNYGEVIWLLGDGRSGTTWVCDLINYGNKYREMFEPIHPEYVSDTSFILPHQYVRRNESNEQLKAILFKIFSGKFTHPRVDAVNQSFLYEGLLIKDIFANLLSYWAVTQFPKVKPVLLIRNPFSVAISKQKNRNWFWFTEPLDLLNQTSLYEDYLYPFEDLIKSISSKKDFILNQILIWSIINYIPLRQFDCESIHISFYENIYNNPNDEIMRIFEFVRGSQNVAKNDIPTEVIERPSRESGTESNLLSGNSPITSWKNEIEPKVIDEGMSILKHFELDNLYSDACVPNMEVIRHIHVSR